MPTQGPDYELAPFIEVCLVLQGFVLNALWVVLMMGWSSSFKSFPKDTLAGGRPPLSQWAVGVVGWSVTFLASLYFMDPVYWFLGLALANGVLLSLVNPAFAMSFLISMLMMRPWEVLGGNELLLEVPRFSMFFAMAWALFYVVAVDRFSLKVNRVLLLLVAFGAWSFLSTFVTPAPGEAQIGVAETIVRALVLYGLIHVVVRDEFSVWVLKMTLVAIFSCVGLIAVVFYLEGYTDGGRVISFGIFKNTNDIAAVMTLLLPLAATPFFRRSSGWLARGLSLIPTGISLLVLGLAQSRGAVLSFGMAAGVFVLQRIRNRKLALLLVGSMALGGFAVTTLFNRASGDLEGSSASRKSFLVAGFRMALFNPVFGVGFGQFPNNFELYATEISHEYGKRTAHSSWVLALAETGFLGLILFAGFFFVGAVRTGYLVSGTDPSWLYAAACYGTSMSFLSHTYLLFPYLLVAGTVSAWRAQQRRQKVYAVEQSQGEMRGEPG